MRSLDPLGFGGNLPIRRGGRDLGVEFKSYKLVTNIFQHIEKYKKLAPSPIEWE